MLRQSLCVLFAAFLSYRIFDLARRFGAFRHVYDHAPGDCFHLPGIEYGSEDIQVLPNGLAFISSGINYKDKRKDKGLVGRILLFDFNRPKEAPEELSILGEERYKTISPHGISLWVEPKTGEVYLYVINHTPEGEAVDKFKFNAAKKSLQHIRRISNEENFHAMINDLTVVAEDQFYYTNAIYWSIPLEMLTLRSWGSVGFFNGSSATIVQKDLTLPNGIAVSKNGKILYLAHLGQEELRLYKRNPDNSLTFFQSIFLGTLPDNLDVDMDSGDVWVGCQPSLFKSYKHMEHSIQHLAPSQILRVRFASDSDPASSAELLEVYSNDGSQLSASSVAVRYKKGVLIGGVYTRALYCQLN